MSWSRRSGVLGVLRAAVLAAAVGGAAPGCGGAADELPRETVTGTVSFKGEPLKAGMIQFQPADPNVSTAAGAAVKDGAYTVTRDQGPVPGRYQVMITSAEAAPNAAVQAVLPGDAPPPSKEPIPARYNVKTELKAEVTKGGPNAFDFKLESK